VKRFKARFVSGQIWPNLVIRLVARPWRTCETRQNPTVYWTGYPTNPATSIAFSQALPV